MIWTTTPWTLPANVAATVKPDAEYVWVELDGERHVVAKERCEAVFGAGANVVGSVRGVGARGASLHDRLRRPRCAGRDCAPRRGRRRHRARRGHGHRPHRARLRRRGLRDRPAGGAPRARAGRRGGHLRPGLRRARRARRARGARHRRRAPRAGRLAAPPGAPRAPLPALLALRHEADLPRRRRVVHPLRRDPPADDRRQRDGRVEAGALRQAHGGLAAQHGRLVHLAQALLGPAAAVLVLRGRPHERHRLAGGAARARDRRARGAAGAAPPVDRPGHDRLRRVRRRGHARARGGRLLARRGHRPVLDARLRRESYEPEGFAAGAGVGLTKADLPDHAYWEKWFPADWISEMREQIRLWFYSQLFMSVTLVGQAPYRSVLGYEKLHDEHGRAMHKSWGNAILARRGSREDGRRRDAAGCSPARTRART